MSNSQSHSHSHSQSQSNSNSNSNSNSQTPISPDAAMLHLPNSLPLPIHPQPVSTAPVSNSSLAACAAPIPSPNPTPSPSPSPNHPDHHSDAAPFSQNLSSSPLNSFSSSPFNNLLHLNHPLAHPPLNPQIMPTSPFSNPTELTTDSDSLLSTPLQPVSSSNPIASPHANLQLPPPHSLALLDQPNQVSLPCALQLELDDSDDLDDHRLSGFDSQRHYKQFGDLENEEILHSGYLEKKGERRKTWKRRWFVLRRTSLVYYKNEKEYRLLRLIPVADIHTCSQVEVKNHDNTFGILTPLRTYYVRARSRPERELWTRRVAEAKALLKQAERSTRSGDDYLPVRPSQPIMRSNTTISPRPRRPPEHEAQPVPHSWGEESQFATLTRASLRHAVAANVAGKPLPEHPYVSSAGSSAGIVAPDNAPLASHPMPLRLLGQNLASSSEEEDEPQRPSSQLVRRATFGAQPPEVALSELIRQEGGKEVPPMPTERKVSLPEAGKTIIQGYLMKQGKRKNWRKRYFKLTSQTLVISRSHMDTTGRAARHVPVGRLLDAIEYASPEPPVSPSVGMSSQSGAQNEHCFKIITSERTYLLSAPTEEDEIRWISAVRCLLASYWANTPNSAGDEVRKVLDRPIAVSGEAHKVGGEERSGGKKRLSIQ